MQIFTGFFYLEKFFLKFFEVLEWYEGGVITTSPPPSFDSGVIPRGGLIKQDSCLTLTNKFTHLKPRNVQVNCIPLWHRNLRM